MADEIVASEGRGKWKATMHDREEVLSVRSPSGVFYSVKMSDIRKAGDVVVRLIDDMILGMVALQNDNEVLREKSKSIYLQTALDGRLDLLIEVYGRLGEVKVFDKEDGAFGDAVDVSLQPIDTAPTDGTVFLGYREEDEAWGDCYHILSDDCEIWSFRGNCAAAERPRFMPSHWMPLPGERRQMGAVGIDHNGCSEIGMATG